MKPIITVENVSKQYQIGVASPAHQNLREAFTDLVKSPWKRLHKMGQASTETIWALRNISFEVQPGDVLGFVGPNGAGKSTLLKILSRITEPTSGRIQLYGRVGSLLEVGTGFHPELTGRENVYLNGAILGMRRDEIGRKFDEIVAFSEVEKFLDTPVKHYSSGMYMRLAFAVAAHLEPEILIVDEVLAVGDAAFQRKCLGKMEEVSQQGRTVLFVSHNITALRSLCKKTIWLDKGEIVHGGETEQIALEYLQKGTLYRLEQRWEDLADAPGSKEVKIRSARVRSLEQSTSRSIAVGSPIQIEFEFWNYQPGAVLNFSLHLLTIEGTYVFVSASEAKVRQQGIVKESVLIPQDLLNDGVYKATIQIIQDASDTLYTHSEILVFEVHESARKVAWYGKWPGVVRPKLEWTSQNSMDEVAVGEYK